MSYHHLFISWLGILDLENPIWMLNRNLNRLVLSVAGTCALCVQNLTTWRNCTIIHAMLGRGRSWFPFCGYFHIYVEKVKLFNVHNNAIQTSKTRAMITKMMIWSLNPLKRLGNKICLLFIVKCRNTHIPVM